MADPIKKQIISILDTGSSGEQKQKEIRALLDKVGILRRGWTVRFCDCGYPVRIIYGDGSVGPLAEVLTEEFDRYYCPRCGKSYLESAR